CDAKAVDAMASVPNTASATRLERRCSCNASDAKGDPINRRFTSEYATRDSHVGGAPRWTRGASGGLPARHESGAPRGAVARGDSLPPGLVNLECRHLFRMVHHDCSSGMMRSWCRLVTSWQRRRRCNRKLMGCFEISTS